MAEGKLAERGRFELSVFLAQKRAESIWEIYATRVPLSTSRFIE
jgi:hypothetical protein